MKFENKKKMRRETFIARIAQGKSCSLLYSTPDRQGLVEIWRYIPGGESPGEPQYIVTWEECPPGQQHNENQYTRDERHVFRSLDEAMDFLVDSGLDLERFQP